MPIVTRTSVVVRSDVQRLGRRNGAAVSCKVKKQNAMCGSTLDGGGLQKVHDTPACVFLIFLPPPFLFCPSGVIHKRRHLSCCRLFTVRREGDAFRLYTVN